MGENILRNPPHSLTTLFTTFDGILAQRQDGGLGLQRDMAGALRYYVGRVAAQYPKVIGKQLTELVQAIKIPVFISPIVQTPLGKHSVYI